MLVAQPLEVVSPQGRFWEGAALLDGHLCTAIDAYGKHLLYRFAHGLSLHIHLGLFGRFRTSKRPAAEPRGAVRVRMVSSSHVVDINGPNCCETLDAAGAEALIARIGPDVLRADADPQRAWMKISKSRVAIGQLLMDQSVIAGIGNIYRSEILWRQRMHPATPGTAITRDMFDSIWDDAVHLLHIGVQRNAIITVDAVKPSRTRYRERVNIFGKPLCPACNGPITQFQLATRRVFTCDACQPVTRVIA
jgi:endonuclease VIII